MTPQQEQQKCADWMRDNGYPEPVTGPRRTQQQLCAMGASDWAVEELLEAEAHRKDYEKYLASKLVSAPSTGFEVEAIRNPV